MPRRHRDRARDVLAEATRIHPAPGALRMAVRVGVVMLVALLVLLALDRMDLALAATFGAFASVYGGRMPRPGRWRTQAGMGLLLTGCVLLGALVGTTPWRSWLAVVAVVLAAAGAAWLSDAQGWRPPGPLFVVFAVGACASIPFTLGAAFAAAGVALATAGFAVALGAIEQRVLPGAGAAPLPMPRARDARWLVAQTVVAVGLAGVIATLVGEGHPYWAMVASVVPLAGASVAAQAARGVQRAAGTVVGLGVAAILLVLPLPPVVVVLLAAVLLALAEFVIGRNYAFGLVAITPLALLLGQLAAPSPVGELLLARLFETMLGLAIGLAIIVLLRPRRRAA